MKLHTTVCEIQNQRVSLSLDLKNVYGLMESSVIISGFISLILSCCHNILVAPIKNILDVKLKIDQNDIKEEHDLKLLLFNTTCSMLIQCKTKTKLDETVSEYFAKNVIMKISDNFNKSFKIESL